MATNPTIQKRLLNNRYHRIAEDDESGAGELIKAVLALLCIAACFAIALCVWCPF